MSSLTPSIENFETLRESEETGPLNRKLSHLSNLRWRIAETASTQLLCFLIYIAGAPKPIAEMQNG